MCGCQLLEELKRCPPPSTGNRAEDQSLIESQTEFAKSQQERWGCPAAGKTPPDELPPDLQQEASYAASMANVEVPNTCPFSCVMAATAWVVELTHAVASQADYGVPMHEYLGRPLTAVDLQALSALRKSKHEALKSDIEIAAREREAEEAQRKALAAQGGRGY